jgi:SAM-dependent methyltransferase
VGNGAGEIPPAPTRGLAAGQSAYGRRVRKTEEPPRNPNSYRITEADRLGDGGPKQKFQQNLKAIETLRALDAQERPATTEEKAALVQYVGWGAMPQVFDDYNREWAKERAALNANLSEEEFEQARSTTLNAHYTSPTVIGAMYQATARFGFQGGRVLEPACGIGHFIGLMPEDMLRRTTVTAVEIDPLTVRIAKALYPDADIRAQPFERTKLADGFYDLAISNVPFGDYTVHDPRWNSLKLPIHDYFFASALEKVRPGGLVMFITSRGTMDKLNSTLRELLRERAELLGAIRLPNDAFKRNAGTEVTTDIVMLRKLRRGESPTGPAWKATASYTNDLGEAFTINEYFAARPEMMLGRLRLTGRMYRDHEPTLEPDGRSLADALAQAIERLPLGIYQAHAHHIAEPNIEETIPAPDVVKPNAFCVHDGIVCLREENVLRPLNDLPSETRSRIRGMIQVRDAVRDCLRAQVDGSPEERVIETRQQLNVAYDRFAARFGPLNLRANQRAFDGDPDLPLLLSLETYNDETKRATKATIFTERTIHHRQPVEAVGTPKEALLVSLNECGGVDLDRMAGLLNQPVEEFLPDLKGVIFRNPQTNEWETDDQYLSGNVREKLAVAVVNVQATEAARDKQEKIKERFKEWIWRRTGAANGSSRKYNDEFNNTALRTFNGDHLTLPGASPHPVAPASESRRLAHPANAEHACSLTSSARARPYTMVAAAMELKRLGFARKPLFAVPNHMLGQFSIRTAHAVSRREHPGRGEGGFREGEAQDVDEPHRHGQLGCRHRDPFRV